MNTNIVASVLAAIALIISIWGAFPTQENFGRASGPQHLQAESFMQGLAAGARDQFSVSNAGALSSSAAVALTSTFSQITSGTTTAKFQSTSSSKGACFELNATSTNTKINITYAASSTASTVGVIQVVRYGACP
jgi:hypothetical protein